MQTEQNPNSQPLVHVEIPIDKYDFDRGKFELGGFLSSTGEKPTIIFVQDEAIFKSYDGAKKFWKMKGRNKLRKNGEGKGVMVSALTHVVFRP